MSNWQLGRQGTGYLVKTLFSFNWGDCHLVKYLPGTGIPPHVDKLVDGRKHYRINIVLKDTKGPDPFQCKQTILNWRRIKIFRPDLHKHSVDVVQSERLLLSIGFAI